MASPNPPPKPPGLLAELLHPAVRWLEGVGRLVMLAAQTVYWTLRPPFRIGLLLKAMEFIGVESIFIIGLTGTFSGMVLTLQTVNALKTFSAEGVVGMITAVSLMRELSPVFTALMVIARGGSSMAAELGNMRVTEQIDALATMGVSPVQYLITPRLIASLVMMPLLCVLFTCVGMAGSWLVAIEGLDIDPGIFIANIKSYIQPIDFWMGMVKSVVFGALLSVISCYQGFFASGGARGVGQATTRAVVNSAVAILIANYLLTSWLMGIGI